MSDPRVVYQCPRCCTSMEIDPTAKPSSPTNYDAATALVQQFENALHVAVIKDETPHIGEAALRKAWDAAHSHKKALIAALSNAFTRRSSGLENVSGYSAPMPTPQVIVDEKIFDQAHGLRDGWAQIHANSEFMAPPEEPSVDGPNAADCNVFLGKPNHYKDGPKDP